MSGIVRRALSMSFQRNSLLCLRKTWITNSGASSSRCAIFSPRAFGSVSKAAKPAKLFIALTVVQRNFGRGRRTPPFGHADVVVRRFFFFTPLAVCVSLFLLFYVTLDWAKLKHHYGIDILPKFLYDLAVSGLALDPDREQVYGGESFGKMRRDSRDVLLAERHADTHAFMQARALRSNLAELAQKDPEVAAILEGRDVEKPDNEDFKNKLDYVLKLVAEIEELDTVSRHPSVFDSPSSAHDKPDALQSKLASLFNVKAEEQLELDGGAEPKDKWMKLGFRSRKIIEYENRIRSYSTPDKIFRYFSTFKVTDERGHSEVMMTPQDFLRSITPGVQQPENLGLDQFASISLDEVGMVSKNFGVEDESIFCQLGTGGLISFSDYVFLLTVLSTSARHFEIAFKMFDLNGDGNVDSKEFENVTNVLRSQSCVGARHRDHQNTGSTLKGINSGLRTYFFGSRRDGILTVDKFLEFQRRLQNEILILEFNRKRREDAISDASKQPTIGEKDFADLLIAYAGFPPKKKNKMLKRVKRAFGSELKSGGIGLADYLNFYQVLYAINDIDTALTFYNMAGAPIERSTMKHVAETVANVQLSDHIVDVVFLLFDESGDGKLSNKEFVSVMKQRVMRGLQNPKDTGVERMFSAIAKCVTACSQPMILSGHRKID